MNSKYFQVTVKPIITSQLANFAADDLLYDWTRFEIPVGTARLVSVSAWIQGTDGAAANEIDADIYFAKSIDGVDPPSLGSSNAAITNTSAVRARPHMIASARWDATELADLGGAFTSFNFYTGELLAGGASAVNSKSAPIILEGERAERTTYVAAGETVSGSTGYQTLYIAASAQGVFNFGTAMLIDNGDGYAVDFEGDINLDGTAGTIIAAPGDFLIAGNDGAHLGVVKTISDDGSHTTLTIDGGLDMGIQDGDEIVLRNPIVYVLGFEY
tara:strand:- start:477 stop:1292 length:816 start_codon:yes stop_codon:yes gene_type:complete